MRRFDGRKMKRKMGHEGHEVGRQERSWLVTEVVQIRLLDSKGLFLFAPMAPVSFPCTAARVAPQVLRAPCERAIYSSELKCQRTQNYTYFNFKFFVFIKYMMAVVKLK